jgi:chromosome segregation protein
MRLKQIKLVGFKSFVDTTKISFQQQMTAIVGPNGCGKSNIIDAVRWVLGESSAKNLRGDAMTDVIFNGATTRKSIGQASVELVFENTQGRIQGNMADRSEVAIKRLVTRDGSNSYFLNGSKCRRRDITDIFLGTGLGPRSYAIIEQGTISRLIESKPQELRVFIEEAAGISKYKEKRKDTENRIRHTQENLERLTDVIAEITTQIDKLHQQAEAAKRYKTLKASERKYKAELSAFRWQQFEQKQQQFIEKQQTQQILIAELQSQQAQDELAIINAKQLLDANNESLAQLQQQKLNLSNDITRIEQTIKHQQQQSLNDKKQFSEVSTEQQKTDHLIRETQQKLAVIITDIAELSPQLINTEQQLTTIQQDLKQQQSEWLLCSEQWDKLNKKVQQQEQESAKLSAQIITKKSLINQYNEQIVQLTTNNNKFSHKDMSHLTELNELVSTQKKQLIQLNNELDNKKNHLEKVQQQLLAQQQQQLIIKTKLQSLNEALILTEKNTPATEQWQHQQNQWLITHHCATYGKIFQQLTVSTSWQLAAEIVLSSWLSAELIDCLPEFSQLKKDEITLPEIISLTINKPSSKASIKTISAQVPLKKGTLAEQVDFNSTHHKDEIGEYHFLSWLQRNYLSKIFLADDVIQAQQLLASLAEDESVLCLDGTWLGHHFLVKGNVHQDDPQIIKQATRVKQQQQQTELTTELSIIDEQLKQRQQQVSLLTEQQNSLINQVNTLTRELQHNKQQQALMVQDQHHQQQQLDQTQQLISQHQQKIAHLTEQLSAIEQNQLKINQQSSVQKENKESVGQVSDHESLIALSEQKQQLQQKTQRLEKQNQQVTQQSHQLSLMLTKKQAEHDNIEQYLNLLLEKQQQLTEKLAPLLVKKDQPLMAQQQQLQVWLQQMSDVEQKIIKQQQDSLENQKIIDQYSANKNTILSKIEHLKEQRNKSFLEAENNRLRAQSMLEQLNDTGQRLTDVLANMPDNVKESQWQANINRLAKDIELLGPINLAAIDEYTRELTRKNFLEQQYQDLTLAITTLNNAIAKIDKQSRQKFQTTFDQVNQDLKRLFPQVFGGGSAYLALTGDDLLETGVTIMARPPGKKNSTIHLLSGGEKALTALSLVFAIFRLNPAPFCMLDEVDAPLDDANVLRFCNLVKEMSKTVQFIYISHNKIAMEMAAHLIGVTMFEAGVSRVVSVDIDQAVAMVET